MWEKAARCLRQAGSKALARSASREAVAYFEQALTHLPETRETQEQAIDIRFGLRDAFVPLAEFGRTEAYLWEAEVLAAALDDQRRLGWVSTYMTAYHVVASGHVTDMRRSLQRMEAIGETLRDKSREAHGHDGIRIAEALDHPFSLVEAVVGLAYLHHIRGDLNPAVRLAERAVALCRD